MRIRLPRKFAEIEPTSVSELYHVGNCSLVRPFKILIKNKKIKSELKQDLWTSLVQPPPKAGPAAKADHTAHVLVCSSLSLCFDLWPPPGEEVFSSVWWVEQPVSSPCTSKKTWGLSSLHFTPMQWKTMLRCPPPSWGSPVGSIHFVDVFLALYAMLQVRLAP